MANPNFISDDEADSFFAAPAKSVPGFIPDDNADGFFAETPSAPVPTPGIDWRDQSLGFLKGVARSGTDVVLRPADLAFRAINSGIDAVTGEDTALEGAYPSQLFGQFLENISGGEGNKTTDAVTNVAGNLATVIAVPSQAQGIANTASSLFSRIPGGSSGIANLFAKTIGLGAEGAAYGALGNSTGEDIGTSMATGAVVNPAIAGLFSGAARLLPSRKIISSAQGIVDDLRSVSPGALSESVTPASRAVTAGENLSELASEAKKAAGAKFDALPGETVILDDAIAAIRNFADEVGGPITPGSSTEKIIRQLEKLKPADKVIETPASAVTDLFGRPLREATRQVIPGGPAKAALSDVQNILRDVRKVGNRADGVDRAVMGRAKSEVLDAVEKSVTPKALEAFNDARSSWASMANTFEKGGIGKIIKSSNDPSVGLNAFKNVLLNDAKATRKLAQIMSPDDIVNSQHLMLSDLLAKQPVSWARTVSNKIDSYEAIFGKEGTNRLLDMVGRDGTIGKKLLQDNNGLKTLFARLALRVGGGAAVGGVFGGEAGALAGALAGAGASTGQGRQVARLQSLLMRGAAGSDDALKILNSPATNKGYGDAISRLASVLSSRTLAEKSEQNLEQPLPDNTPLKPKTAIRSLLSDVSPPQKRNIAMSDSSVPPELVKAVVKQESSGNPDAISPVGAKGLMQIMPATAKDIAAELGVKDYDLSDPETNLKFGSHYLGKLIQQFDGDVELALTAYHSGPARVERLLKETGGSTLADIIDLLGPVGKKYASGVIKKMEA